MWFFFSEKIDLGPWLYGSKDTQSFFGVAKQSLKSGFLYPPTCLSACHLPAVFNKYVFCFHSFIGFEFQKGKIIEQEFKITKTEKTWLKGLHLEQS